MSRWSGAGRGSDSARLAVDVHAHRLRREIAAMAAAMGGLDVLAFTGGIGEHQSEARAEAVAGLGFLGVVIDAAANAAAELARLSRHVAYPAGERLFEEGRTADTFWIIDAGRVMLDASVPAVTPGGDRDRAAGRAGGGLSSLRQAGARN